MKIQMSLGYIPTRIVLHIVVERLKNKEIAVQGGIRRQVLLNEEPFRGRTDDGHLWSIRLLLLRQELPRGQTSR